MKQTLIIQINEGKEFLRGEHPDKRTNKQWVKEMNIKFPELQWGLLQKEKKEIKRKTAGVKKIVKRTVKKKAVKKASRKVSIKRKPTKRRK